MQRTVISFILLSLSVCLRAQCPYEWSDEFSLTGIGHGLSIAPGLPLELNDAVCFDDGTGSALYAAGSFVVAGGSVGNGVARWNGQRWESLAQSLSPSARVSAMAVFGGELFIGGNFSTIDGLPAYRVARWDGSSFVAVPGYPGFDVTSMAVYDPGTGPKLYIGGSTTPFTPTASVLTAFDGTSWSSVLQGSGPITNLSSISSLVVFDSGTGPSLHLGGNNVLGTSPPTHVARYDGTSFSPLGTGTNGAVRKLAVASLAGLAPRLFVAGAFTQAGTAFVSGIASWNGTQWNALPNAPTFGGNIRSLEFATVAGQSRLFVGFVTANATLGALGGVLAFDGVSTWAGLSTGIGAGPDPSLIDTTAAVTAMEVYDEGQGPRLFVFGRFDRAGSRRAFAAARFDGAEFTSVGGAAPSHVVYALAGSSDGQSLYAGGFFTGIGDRFAHRIAVWNGTNWSPLGAGVDASVYAIEFDGNDVYAGGEFATASGQPSPGIARWDGSNWHSLSTGLERMSGTASTFAIRRFTPQGGMPLVCIGGAFDVAGGIPASNVAAWNGTSWQALGTGVNGDVSSLAVFDDGSGPALYVAGNFSIAGGVNAANIARFDGTTWSALGTGINGPVYALEVYDDGSGPFLVAGGHFTGAGGSPASDLAAWNGTTWTPLGAGITSAPAFGAVYALRSFDDGHRSRLAIGGLFSAAGAVSSLDLVFWNGSQFEAASNFLGSFDPAVTQSVFALTTLDGSSGNALYVGGQFATSTVEQQRHLAAWRPDSDSPACASLDACADGNVGIDVDGPHRVLFVNGKTGGRSHRVGAGLSSPISIDMTTPATSPAPTPFTLFAYLDAPTPMAATALPFGIGVTCFPFCIAGVSDPLSLTVADSFGFGALVCAPLAPATLTPWTLAHPGLPVPARVALQGLVLDPSRPLGIAVTNAVLLVIGS